MLNYTLKRIAAMVPILLAVSLLVFALIQLQPGNFVDDLKLSNPNMTVQEADNLRRAYGLDQPWYVQYGKWLGHAVQGDFGVSRKQYIPAATFVVQQRMGNTLLLGAGALTLSLLIGIPLGILSAVKQYSVLDYVTTFFAFVGFSLPVFWFGLMLLIVFSVNLKVLPAGGLSSANASPLVSTEATFDATGPVTKIEPASDGTRVTVEIYDADKGAAEDKVFTLPAGVKSDVQVGDYVSPGQPYGRSVTVASWLTYALDRLKYLVLPTVALAVIQIATWTRFMRAALLDVINQDYVRTARAKGLRESRVIYKHALRNALIPVITLIGLSLPGLVNGAVITETVFNYPGMGLALYQSILDKDYNPAMVILLLLALITLLANLLTDLAYALLSPRIRFS
ncbi:ABC transporter permease [Deinococcus marmoris]|uniref:Dipeptide transport system permease protein DppB n=1 Tax=Deinococcus marmoris TaxID=249408 RepID=A0A1U7NR37_9DEIO|nr:ABC transporter permease [Deinococcus marmoris]OLV15382.1 Dipeptide transport system permease protein DppB [Deinococcus marmoris]